MRWRKTVRVFVGLILILLGLLWVLQGADLVRIRPILCVAECEPMTGESPGWLAAGVVTMVVGLIVMAFWRRRPWR